MQCSVPQAAKDAFKALTESIFCHLFPLKQGPKSLIVSELAQFEVFRTDRCHWYKNETSVTIQIFLLL